MVTVARWPRQAVHEVAPPATKRLGIEADHLTLVNRAKLQASFPGVELVDISQHCMRERMLKSDEEIAVIKNGAVQ